MVRLESSLVVLRTADAELKSGSPGYLDLAAAAGNHVDHHMVTCLVWQCSKGKGGKIRELSLCVTILVHRIHWGPNRMILSTFCMSSFMPSNAMILVSKGKVLVSIFPPLHVWALATSSTAGQGRASEVL